MTPPVFTKLSAAGCAARAVLLLTVLSLLGTIAAGSLASEPDWPTGETPTRRIDQRWLPDQFEDGFWFEYLG